MTQDPNIHSHSSAQRYYFIVGLLTLISLIILAVIFFRERIAFADTAYQAVYLLIEQRPYVNWIRAASIIPQIIPLTAIWLHATLRTVMVLHSLSFLIFFLAIYLLSYYFSRRHLLFLIIPVYLVLITNEVFYWPQSEYQQGMLWLCLYAVFLFEDRWVDTRRWQTYAIHFLFILWIQFLHPLIFFPMAFLIVYYYDSRQGIFSREGLNHLILCIISFVIRYAAGLFNTYEKGKLNIGIAIRDHLPHLLSLGSVHSFIHRLWFEYAVYLILLVSAAIWLVIHRRFFKFLALFIFTFGYWVLIMITDASDQRFYTENMLLPLGFIAALPFVVDILPRFRHVAVTALVSLVIVIRLGFIFYAHHDYTDRFQAYDPYFRYIASKKLNGIFVEEKNVDSRKMIMTWASGYESMLISSLASPDSCSIIQIDGDAGRYSYALGFDTSVVTIYGIWGQSQVPQRYFHLRRGKYEILHAPL